MTRFSGLLPAIIIAASAFMPDLACAQAPAAVTVTAPWSRATMPAASTAVVYMTVTSAADDRLDGASSSVAAHASVHESRMDGTVMKMRDAEGGLELPAGHPVALRPSGYHIMLEGLKHQLKAGETVPVHLTFRHAPPLDIQATVLAAGADHAPAGHDAMPGMTMGK
jgi:copper(I)-binding protein